MNDDMNRHCDSPSFDTSLRETYMSIARSALATAQWEKAAAYFAGAAAITANRVERAQ